MDDSISRRAVLLRGLQLLPAGGVLASALAGCSARNEQRGSAARGASCADLSSMSDTELNTRRSLGYTETSPNPQQTCAACAFFHPGSDGSECGTCDILSGSVVNGRGYCNSWSPKA